jgi:hypothetical protein
VEYQYKISVDISAKLQEINSINTLEVILVLRNSPLQELIGKSDIGDILNSALCRQDFGLNECISS